MAPSKKRFFFFLIKKKTLVKEIFELRPTVCLRTR